MNASQSKQILDYMEQGNKITQAEAVKLFGCYRLSARIADLRKLGYAIKTNQKLSKNRNGNTVNFAEYELVKE